MIVGTKNLLFCEYFTKFAHKSKRYGKDNRTEYRSNRYFS